MQNSAGTENFNNQYIVLSVTSGVLHFFGDSLVPDTINKNFPEGAKVLQQVDNKFIPIVASTALDITDQVYFVLCIIIHFWFLMNFPNNLFTLNDCFS